MLFITNKTVTHIPQILPNNLLIVHSENIESYYGPFVAKFAELTKFKDEKEIDSDDDVLYEFNMSDEEN